MPTPSELYPAESNYLLSVEALQAPGVRFFVAVLDDEVIGCGALKRLAPEAAEVKRMWVDLAHRGKGYGSAILAALETRSIGGGHTGAAAGDWYPPAGGDRAV